MSNEPLVPFDARKANIARAYDHILGGKDNYAVDRELAAKMLEVYPLAGVLARENRAFLARAIDYVSRQGVGQFIDVGAGLPTSPNTHEVACRVNPDARVVYVDNDPIVISHARALLAADGQVAAAPGDVRPPAATPPPRPPPPPAARPPPARGAAPPPAATRPSAELATMIDLNEPVCVI